MMKIAGWNLNHRVGRTRFQPAAAEAILSLQPDVVVLTEYFPKENESSFRSALAESLPHSVSTDNDGEPANRALIASRFPLERIDLRPPSFDRQFPSNVCGVQIPSVGFAVIGIRIPFYEGKDLPKCEMAWDWLLGCASDFEAGPTILIGDFNANDDSKSNRGGAHFRHLQKRLWKRAQHAGRSFAGVETSAQIDHLFVTPYARVTRSELIERANGFNFCEGKEAISDHAVILADVELDPTYVPESDSYLYEDELLGDSDR